MPDGLTERQPGRDSLLVVAGWIPCRDYVSGQKLTHPPVSTPAGFSFVSIGQVTLNRVRQKNAGTTECNSRNNEFKHQNAPYTFCALDGRTLDAFRFQECFVDHKNGFTEIVWPMV